MTNLNRLGRLTVWVGLFAFFLSLFHQLNAQENSPADSSRKHNVITVDSLNKRVQQIHDRMQKDSQIYAVLNVMEKDSGSTLDTSKVTLINTTKNIQFTDYAVGGVVRFPLDPKYNYEILVEKEGYLSKRAQFEACGLVEAPLIFCAENFDMINYVDGNYMADRMIIADMVLEKKEIGKTFKLENIYYDYNKWNIREDAAVELDKLIVILNDNPEIVIELGSHTDSRGSDGYNRSLSQKRADSAVTYILTGGINSARISGRGYGESQLVNRCRNGVNCSKEEHQENRRTEFKIVDIQ